MSEQYGRDVNTGKVYRLEPVNQGGCCSTLVVIGVVIALFIFGFSLFSQSISNYFTYHIWESDTAVAIQDVTATAEAPYRYLGRAENAVTTGHTYAIAMGTYDGTIVHLDPNATLTFNNVQVAGKGHYNLTVTIGDPYPYSNHDYSVDGNVNGGHDFELLFPSLGPNYNDIQNTQTNSIDILLNAGNNTIKFYNAEGGGSDCATNATCTGIVSIAIDRVQT